MHAIGRALFGTVVRRLLALTTAGAVYYLIAQSITHYVDTACTSAGLSLLLIVTWFVLGIATAFVTAVALSDLLIGQAFLDDFLSDEMALLDERLASEQADDDLDDLAFLKGGANETKFGLYFLLFAAVHLVAANNLADDFLGRYMHSGLALIKLRSDDEIARRQGHDMLAEKLDVKPTKDVESAVIRALKDPMEGVVVRAAHIAGTLRIQSTANVMVDLVDQRPELAFPLLIAIGLLDSIEARDIASRLSSSPAARAEPVALAYMFGMLKADELTALVDILESAKDVDARVAAVWALGELRDNRLLPKLELGLSDPSLKVQCTAIAALEKLVATDAAPSLMKAFEAAEDIHAQCPEILVPVQEGGPIRIVTKYRLKLFSLVRALATTDHPDLIPCLVKNQNVAKDYNTKILMKKLWEKLTAKNKAGELNMIKQRLRRERLKRQQGQEEKTNRKSSGAHQGDGKPGEDIERK